MSWSPCSLAINSIAFLLPSLQSVVSIKTIERMHSSPASRHRLQALRLGMWLGWLCSAHRGQSSQASKQALHVLMQASIAQGGTVLSSERAISRQALQIWRILACSTKKVFHFFSCFSCLCKVASCYGHTHTITKGSKKQNIYFSQDVCLQKLRSWIRVILKKIQVYVLLQPNIFLYSIIKLNSRFKGCAIIFQGYTYYLHSLSFK